VGKLEQALKSCRAAIDANDVARIKTTMDELTQLSHKIAEVMYRQAGGEQANAGAAHASTGNATGGDGTKSRDDDVIDAEFEEKKN
jgi:molecular chaperone DnaK